MIVCEDVVSSGSTGNRKGSKIDSFHTDRRVEKHGYDTLSLALAVLRYHSHDD
jgi:hypothetical protein